MTTISAHELLSMIERIVADDFCENFAMAALQGKLTQREKTAGEKLRLIYRIVHSLDKAHPCHGVHKRWRRQVFGLLCATREEMERAK